MRFFAILLGCILFALGAHADCTVTNLGVAPLMEAGLNSYKNVRGGLYPNGANTRPPEHLAAGIELAANGIVARDASGSADSNSGKIVLLSIGMSNTTAEFGTNRNGAFKLRADAEPAKNPQMIIVDGAQGGQPAPDWTNFGSPTWSAVQQRLTAAGVTSNQVQVIWMKQARARPTNDFPVHSDLLQNDLENILRVAQRPYPNLKIAYLSSRTRAYTTEDGALNPEPFAFESAFSVRGVIEKQLNGNLNYKPDHGTVIAPWVSWGPYLWADGTSPRSDGFTWLCSDLQPDFTHPSDAGVRKVATQLLAFFKTDPTATPWFLRKEVIGMPPNCTLAASVTNGVAPLTVNFSAIASDSDGTIHDYQWTFDDGTFSTNANPTKIFETPGVYTVRVTVTDNDGNSATRPIEIRVAAVTLGNPSIVSNRFQMMVLGATNYDYVVQRSDQFTNWISVATNRGSFLFTETNSIVSPQRFYRAVKP